MHFLTRHTYIHVKLHVNIAGLLHAVVSIGEVGGIAHRFTHQQEYLESNNFNLCISQYFMGPVPLYQ